MEYADPEARNSRPPKRSLMTTEGMMEEWYHGSRQRVLKYHCISAAGAIVISVIICVVIAVVINVARRD